MKRIALLAVVVALLAVMAAKAKDDRRLLCFGGGCNEKPTEVVVIPVEKPDPEPPRDRITGSIKNDVKDDSEVNCDIGDNSITVAACNKQTSIAQVGQIGDNNKAIINQQNVIKAKVNITNPQGPPQAAVCKVDTDCGPCGTCNEGTCVCPNPPNSRRCAGNNQECFLKADGKCGCRSGGGTTPECSSDTDCGVCGKCGNGVCSGVDTKCGDCGTCSKQSGGTFQCTCTGSSRGCTGNQAGKTCFKKADSTCECKEGGGGEECQNDNDCESEDKPVCNTLTGKCVQCLTKGDCSGPCAECQSFTCKASNTFCKCGTCLPNTFTCNCGKSSTSNQCPAGEACVGKDDSCECKTGCTEACTSKKPFCDGSTCLAQLSCKGGGEKKICIRALQLGNTGQEVCESCVSCKGGTCTVKTKEICNCPGGSKCNGVARCVTPTP